MELLRFYGWIIKKITICIDVVIVLIQSSKLWNSRGWQSCLLVRFLIGDLWWMMDRTYISFESLITLVTRFTPLDCWTAKRLLFKSFKPSFCFHETVISVLLDRVHPFGIFQLCLGIKGCHYWIGVTWLGKFYNVGLFYLVLIINFLGRLPGRDIMKLRLEN